MEQFPKYKYCEDNDLIYELGEHDIYYPIIFVLSAEKNCCTTVEAKTKLDYMKEHRLELYVELVDDDELDKHINNYLYELSYQTDLIFSRMKNQNKMGRLLAEKLARDNLL